MISAPKPLFPSRNSHATVVCVHPGDQVCAFCNNIEGVLPAASRSGLGFTIPVVARNALEWRQVASGIDCYGRVIPLNPGGDDYLWVGFIPSLIGLREQYCPQRHPMEHRDTVGVSSKYQCKAGKGVPQPGKSGGMLGSSAEDVWHWSAHSGRIRKPV